MKRLVLGTVMALMTITTNPAMAGDHKTGALQVHEAWAPATPGKVRNGAAYLTLMNAGAKADRLIGVSSPVAKKTELHRSIMEDGVMHMRPVASLPVKPGAHTMLEPGGVHIMLMGLKAPLREGDKFPVVLTFEHAGASEITVTVKKRHGHKMKH